MKTITLKIDAALSGRRIEYVLEKHIGLSRSLINRLKRIDNAVLLNGSAAAVLTKAYDGDVLTVNVPAACTDGIVPVEMPLEILYEDEDIIAINKPRAMPTHPSHNHQSDTLANGVMYYLGGKGEFHAITRLDCDTSGVVLIAKNTVAAKLLTDDIKNKRIEKQYIAVVCGVPRHRKGKISAPIKKEEGKTILRKVAPDGKEATTLYEVLNTEGELSWMKLFPLTGRTHQLRVHMSYIGTPIYGDEMYGAPQKEERTRLHCHKISFYHPACRERTDIIAPLPGDMEPLSTVVDKNPPV